MPSDTGYNIFDINVLNGRSGVHFSGITEKLDQGTFDVAHHSQI